MKAWVRITIAEYVGHEQRLEGRKELVFSQEEFLADTRTKLDDWNFESAEMPISEARAIGPFVRQAIAVGDIPIIWKDE
jgi:hypothetical protein